MGRKLEVVEELKTGDERDRELHEAMEGEDERIEIEEEEDVDGLESKGGDDEDDSMPSSSVATSSCCC